MLIVAHLKGNLSGGATAIILQQLQLVHVISQTLCSPYERLALLRLRTCCAGISLLAFSMYEST